MPCDDVNGGDIPLGLVKEARREEVGFMSSRGIWVGRTVEECWKKTMKSSVSVRWVDTNKGGLRVADGESVGGKRL